MKKTFNGSITVYCTMILGFILLFLGGLLVFNEQHSMKTWIRADMDAAATSVMGEYEKEWVQEYGLYVLPKEKIESGMLFYMEQNSQHGWGSYHVDELEVTQVKTLQDTAVLQEQILMFMNERGLFDFIEEIGSSVLQIKDLEKQVDEEVNWKESDELLWIQQLYSELVTMFEGIRSDGTWSSYSINRFLEEEPSLSEVIEALKNDKPTSEQIGVLEQAYDEMDQVAVLCASALEVEAELIKAIDQLEKTEELPITMEELRSHERSLKRNKEMCEDAAESIRLWIREITEGEEKSLELRTEALTDAEQLVEYDRSIQFPYEYKESNDKWDFSSILSSLRGYPFDISEIAPDEDLDLGLEEAEEEELDLDNVSISDSFGDQFLVTEYVLGVFQNFREAALSLEGEKALNLRGEEKQQHFLKNEVEYLLIGKANEYKNVNGTRNYILTLRSVLNMVHLLTDSEKRAEIEVLAGAIGGILMPGIGNGIFFGIILTAWSLGEAIVDYQILVEGGEIPLLKTKESWRTDISSILSLDIPDAEEDPGDGMTYEQYLRIMLYSVDQGKILERIQTLLSLNHQNRSLAEAVTHFVVEGHANGTISTYTFSGDYGYGMDKE